MGLDSETRAAFGSAGVDDLAATCCLHANTKTVGFLAAGYGWLVGTFHDVTLGSTS